MVAESIRERYHRPGESFGTSANRLAADLMRGDPAAFKAGYTRPNALMVAAEVFPEAAEQLVGTCRSCDRTITRGEDGAWEDHSGACGCGDGEHEPMTREEER